MTPEAFKALEPFLDKYGLAIVLVFILLWFIVKRLDKYDETNQNLVKTMQKVVEQVNNLATNMMTALIDIKNSQPPQLREGTYNKTVED